jgi:hypothetical protein
MKNIILFFPLTVALGYGMNGGFIPQNSFLYNPGEVYKCFAFYEQQISALGNTSSQKQKDLEEAIRTLESLIEPDDLSLLPAYAIQTLEDQGQKTIKALKKKLEESK